MQNNTIFFIGLSFVVVALVAMATIYVRMLIEERAYCRGRYYADELAIRLDRLRESIPLYGLLLFVGLVVMVFDFLIAPI